MVLNESGSNAQSMSFNALDALQGFLNVGFAADFATVKVAVNLLEKSGLEASFVQTYSMTHQGDVYMAVAGEVSIGEEFPISGGLSQIDEFGLNKNKNPNLYRKQLDQFLEGYEINASVSLGPINLGASFATGPKRGAIDYGVGAALISADVGLAYSRRLTGSLGNMRHPD